MELSEATELAELFVSSVMFRTFNLPASDRASWARQWWEAQQRSIPLGPALEESRRLLTRFASRKTIDKAHERHRYLVISAMTHDFGLGRCPQLGERQCRIYARRPLTCRTVPLHYSRAPSGLGAYLDAFTRTPGYDCDTSAAAEPVLEGRAILSPAIVEARDAASGLAARHRAWKAALLARMERPLADSSHGLPSLVEVMANGDQGQATTLPMVVAWRVLMDMGGITPDAFALLCRQQMALLRAVISPSAAQRPDATAARSAVDLIAVYDAALGLVVDKGNRVPSA